jgi:hypothetical protein
MQRQRVIIYLAFCKASRSTAILLHSIAQTLQPLKRREHPTAIHIQPMLPRHSKAILLDAVLISFFQGAHLTSNGSVLGGILCDTSDGSSSGALNKKLPGHETEK